MSKVLHSRLFRFLVCFLVICCILVNLSPLKAEATAVVGTALTLEGILALLFSMALGVVAVDLSAETINRIGTDLEETIITEVDTTELQKWYNLKTYYEKINPDGNGPDDPLEWTKLLKEALAGGLLVAITGWLCTLVNMDGYEIDIDTVPEGWAFYGDYLLPEIPSSSVISGSYYLINLYPSSDSSDTSYGLYISESPFSIISPGNLGSLKVSSVTTFSLYDFVDDSWALNPNFSTFTLYPGGNFSIGNNYPVWANFDVYYYNSTDIYLVGSEAKYKYSEVITPIYVGDIPNQIKNGELDEDDIVLPVVDPFKLITSPNAGANEINQMQQALKDGTITIDDYLQQVQVQDQPDTEDPSNPSEDPSETTDPTVAVDPWEPPEDPGQFALDLSEVFPFCIPFDLYDFLSLLNADPVAPVIDWEIALPGGGSYPLQIDLSPFDSVAQLLRRLQLLLFIVALGIKTRDLIKG